MGHCFHYYLLLRPAFISSGLLQFQRIKLCATLLLWTLFQPVLRQRITSPWEDGLQEKHLKSLSMWNKVKLSGSLLGRHRASQQSFTRYICVLDSYEAEQKQDSKIGSGTVRDTNGWINVGLILLIPCFTGFVFNHLSRQNSLVFLKSTENLLPLKMCKTTWTLGLFFSFHNIIGMSPIF